MTLTRLKPLLMAGMAVLATAVATTAQAQKVVTLTPASKVGEARICQIMKIAPCHVRAKLSGWVG